MVAAWAFAMVLASLFLATPALAKDYSIDAVNIAAAVNSDGTLSVTEMRDFNFDGSFHGVYWKQPLKKCNARHCPNRCCLSTLGTNGARAATLNRTKNTVLLG